MVLGEKVWWCEVVVDGSFGNAGLCFFVESFLAATSGMMMELINIPRHFPDLAR